MEKNFTAFGRINLIGEHLDYNGGLVLPTTIDLAIHLAIKNSTDKYIFSSHNHVSFSFCLEQDFPTEHAWYQYPLSVLRYLQEKNIALPNGLELNYNSDIPEGSGLSSSAAILVVTLKAFNEILKLNWSVQEIAKIAQFIENQYIGVNCGIMDSYVIAHNFHDSALLIDCLHLSHEKIPLPIQEKYKFLILDTQLPRSLRHSAYNERRQTCEQALSIIQKHKNILHLAEADYSDLEFLKDEILFKRAYHVISEQQRVILAAKYLKNNDFVNFGKLMNESHYSLKNYYEVSCEELDFLVAQMNNQTGCLGARMTGAGFGGCAIALIDNSFDLNILPDIQNAYYQKFRFYPKIFIGKEKCFS